MLISVHLPKTAGSSFLRGLEQHFGERLVQDYGDRPINKGTVKRNFDAVQSCVLNTGSRSRFRNIDCIHGHFMPLKYRYLSTPTPKLSVVWVRDPVERLASHYQYWVERYHPIDSGKLHRRVVEEKWSLERFCLGPEMKNVYSKFFWGFSLRRFDFVGITEFYDSEIERFSQQILNAPLDKVWVNANPNRFGQRYIDDLDFRRKIQAHHSADVALYKEALSIRESCVFGARNASPADA
jgi:hypothetical protein